MIARIVGATLGLFLALGATVAVNPDGKVAQMVSNVAAAAPQQDGR